VCGPYGSAPTDVQSNIQAKNIEHYLDVLGIQQKIEPPKYKEFSTFEARLKSFDKCLKILEQDINTLCEAGLFYTGKIIIIFITLINLPRILMFYYFLGHGTNDHMTCFYCGKSLHNWEDNDEPWVEHAKWSINCSFLLLNKGKNFVDKACGMKSNITESNQKVIYP